MTYLILYICHINVQSLVHKDNFVTVEWSCHDVITISETWLDNSIESNAIAIPNFQPPSTLIETDMEWRGSVCKK